MLQNAADSNALAKAGIELGENGNIFPRPKGKDEHYFKALPGTEEFATEYQRWLAGHDGERQGIRGTRPGSMSALIAKFYRSGEWANHSDATQTTYRGILERFRNDNGDKPVNQLERRQGATADYRQGRRLGGANVRVRWPTALP